MAANGGSHCCGPGYASPAEAMKAPREKILYTVALYIGTGIQKPDYLATIDADPESLTYSQVISRLEMPGIGDELHHMGWNACSSCHHDPTKQRRYLIVPGVRSSNLHIVDCGIDHKAPRLHKVIAGGEIKSRTNLSAPHTVHCLGSDIIISMLGDARGNAPGGFLHLNENFDIVGRWENDLGGMKFNYDFWYQPRHNVMVSSEWAAPNTFMPGFDLEEVGHLKYGREIHFWDFKGKRVEKTMYLGEDGLVPLEVRFHHDPDSSHGFVGAGPTPGLGKAGDGAGFPLGGVGVGHRAEHRIGPLLATGGISGGPFGRRPVGDDEIRGQPVGHELLGTRQPLAAAAWKMTTASALEGEPAEGQTKRRAMSNANTARATAPSTTKRLTCPVEIRRVRPPIASGPSSHEVDHGLACAGPITLGCWPSSARRSDEGLPQVGMMIDERRRGRPFRRAPRVRQGRPERRLYG